MRGSPGAKVAAREQERLSGRGSLPEKARVAEGQESPRQVKRVLTEERHRVREGRREDRPRDASARRSRRSRGPRDARARRSREERPQAEKTMLREFRRGCTCFSK